MKKKQKVLVCGASGFIGRNVFEALLHNDTYDVYGTYRTRRFSHDRNVFCADFTSKRDALRILRGMDVVIQCAAVTSGARDIVSRPYIHITDNLVMNAHLLEAAFHNRVKHFVFLSCSIMYPMNADRPMCENDIDLHGGIHNRYFGGAWMKLSVERMCEFYSQLGHTQFTIIRHSNIYGPHDKFDLKRSHVFGATITKVMRAKPGAVITVWGDGRERRDLLYVSDLTDFIGQVLVRQDLPFEIVNVGQGKSITVARLVRSVVRHSGKQLSIIFDRSKPTIPSKLALDCSRAFRIYNWRPKVGLDDGIKKTLAWYKENF